MRNPAYLLGTAFVASSALASACSSSAPTATSNEPLNSDLRPNVCTDVSWSGRAPASPLLVRAPYLSSWQPADSLAGTWPTFWNGNIKALTGIARIDGKAFTFMGSPGGIGSVPNMTITGTSYTPTRTTYSFGGGGVALTVEFLSPVETTDLQHMSVPLGYVSASAASADGSPHAVSLYFDISAEWAHGDSNTKVRWARQSIPSKGGSLTAFSVTPDAPQPLVEVNEYPAWGNAIWAAQTAGNLTTEAGQDTVVRNAAVSQGRLDGSVDTGMPRAINDRWPVFGFNFDLGNVAQATAPVVLVLGHAREPAVSYLGNPVAPLWRSYWPDWPHMAADTFDDFASARGRADALDARVVNDARAVGGDEYAALCDLALRQAFGGTELVGTASKPWLFLKEISSDGNVSTIDVVYPASPAFLYTNPHLLRLMLDPLFAYAETGGWPKAFAEHDIGSSYPNAAGHNDGNEEDMPVEESANMLLMTAAYLRLTKDPDAVSYVSQHYTILKKWADYLVPNTLDPVLQNQTDDFTGFINHSVNLALKGILAVGAMGQLAQATGHGSDASSYAGTAQSYISQWASKAADSDHLKLEYDLSGTWSLKYNAFFDRVLGLHLVPSSVLKEEAAWYMGHAAAYGVPLDNRHSYTKLDWELWTAGSTDDTTLRQSLIHQAYLYATTSTNRVPLSDWYDTGTAAVQGFQARPVVGGVFAPILRAHAPQ